MIGKKRTASAAVLLLAPAVLVLVFASAGAGAHAARTAAASRAASAPGASASKPALPRRCETAGCRPSVEHQQAEIWVMNGDGSAPRRLTHNTTWDLSPAWSPNGETIAFYEAEFDPITDQPLGPPHIHLIDANGGDETLLTSHPARFPSFSPDGQRIAFDDATGPNSGADIFVINEDGTGLQPLTHDPAARNIRPDWSPDGEKIAFASRRDGHGEIYVMNTDGSDQTRLTKTDPSVTNNAPAWSPDGQKIVFQSNRDKNEVGTPNTEIYVMNADGSDQTRLTTHDGRDEDPDWSPNGKTIAYNRDIGRIQDMSLEVCAMNADGTEPTALTDLPTENAHPGYRR